MSQVVAVYECVAYDCMRKSHVLVHMKESRISAYDRVRFDY